VPHVQQTTADFDAGIALEIRPNESWLDPFGQVACDISCLSSMIGDYTTFLHISVGDSFRRTLPVRACIVGSPSHVQAAARCTSTHVGQTELAIPFGSVLCHHTASRHFHVFNRTNFDIDIDFDMTIVQKDPSKHCVALRLSAAADGSVAAKVKCALWC
jgi:hypothetical protein